jgi:GT2 family glycosyltransferase
VTTEPRLSAKKVAAVVVTHNRERLLTNCLESLLGQTADGFGILVIDNASTDGTRQYVESLADDRIHYHNTGRNLGGAGGFNWGIRQAMADGYSHVWLMDDDAAPEPGAFDALMAADSELDGQYGFLSSATYWTDGEPSLMNLQHTTLVRKLSLDSAPADGRVRVILATFVSLFLPVGIVDELGLPISEFFIWADDWEFTRRISRRYPCYAVLASRVVHHLPSNWPGTLATDVPDRFWRYEYSYRNECYFYRQEGAVGVMAYLARVGLHAVRILRYAKDLRLQRLRLLAESAWGGFQFNPPVEYPTDTPSWEGALQPGLAQAEAATA